MRARLRHEDAMRAVLNWDRGNQLADYFLAFMRDDLSQEECTVPTTAEYTLSDINQGYKDMHAGNNIRGIITHSH